MCDRGREHGSKDEHIETTDASEGGSEKRTRNETENGNRKEIKKRNRKGKEKS